MNPIMSRCVAAALATALCATTAAAEPFTLLIFETAKEIAHRTDTGKAGLAYWGSYADFAGEAGKAGILRGGAALYAQDKVLSVTVADGKVSAGPAFDESDGLRLGGFFTIDVPDRAAAIAWAAKLPAARTGRIEIRGDYPAPGMN